MLAVAEHKRVQPLNMRAYICMDHERASSIIISTATLPHTLHLYEHTLRIVLCTAQTTYDVQQMRINVAIDLRERNLYLFAFLLRIQREIIMGRIFIYLYRFRYIQYIINKILGIKDNLLQSIHRKRFIV